MDIIAEATARGYSAEHSAALEEAYTKKVSRGELPEIIYDYPAWRTGNYSAAQGGDFEVVAADIVNTAEAVNHLYKLGHPIALIDGHGSGVSVGVMPAARVDAENVLRCALITDWMVAGGIKDGTSGLSIEADRDYSSEAYTGGKDYRYWPTAWAVLPAGQKPAVPAGEPIAAGEPKSKHVRLYAHETAPVGGESPIERGRVMAEETKIPEPKENPEVKTISELEAVIKDLTEKLATAVKERDELAGEKEAAVVEAAEKVVEARTSTILAAEGRPGIREKIQAQLKAAEGAKAKSILLDAFETMFEEKELAGAKLQASAFKAQRVADDAEDKYINAAEARAKKDNISFTAALNLVVSEELEG